MAESNALITIDNAVRGYLLRNKRSHEDMSSYLDNACLLLQDYMIYDSNEARCEKVAVSALGIIEMPSDLIRVKDVCVAKEGEWWSFTERINMVNTTTTTAGIEGHSTTFGEGAALKDAEIYGLGSRGGVNDYYYAVDYKARRIFCDGITSDTVLLRYVSSGLVISGTTYIPSFLLPLLDLYLFYKEAFWTNQRQNEIDARARSYEKERLRVHNLVNSMSSSQWQDLFYSMFSQNPRR